MTEIDTLEGEWQELAIDNGDTVLQPNEYYAELDDGNTVISTRITSVSYSPSVNKAKNLKIDVPPEPSLEDSTYLGETLRVYVDNKKLFQGNVVVLSTTQNNGEDYTIEAEPPGKKLKGEDIDKQVSNKSVYDTIAEVIDEYNDFDARHSDVRGSSQEITNGVEHIGLDILESEDGGLAFYQSVGSAVENLDTIYAKMYTPSNSSMDVHVVPGGKNYSESFSSLDKNRYGEWVEINPDVNDTGEYDLSFTFDSDCRLIDWIAITDHEIKRVIDTPDISYTSETPNGNEKDFYSKDITDLVEDANNISDGVVVNDEEGEEEIRTRKVSEWYSFSGFEPTYSDDVDEQNQGETIANPDAVDGREFFLKRGQVTPDLSPRLSIFDTMENYGLYLRLRAVDPDDLTDYSYNVLSTSGNTFWNVDITINGETDNLGANSGALRTNQPNHNWSSSLDVLFDDLDEISEFKLRTRENSDFLVAIDSIVFIHKKDELNWQFDNDVSEVNGEKTLSRPAKFAYSDLYGEPQTVDLKPFQSDENITSATVDATFSDTGSGLGTWGVTHTLKVGGDGGYTEGFNNTNTLSSPFPYPGTSHTVRVALSARSSGSGIPTEGDTEQKLTKLEVDAAFNDIDIIADENLTDNRLGAVNSLCNDSSALSRFDSNVIKVFPRGSRKNDVDLYKETVSSSTTIKEVYKSCKVKGKDDVNGDRIQVENPPDSISKDKFIISRDIESEEAANAKARSFLKNHGEIDYSGDIKTLPTLAPVGEMLDGSKFNHGKDMIIENVRYGKRSTKISLGFTENIATQLIETSRKLHNVEKEGVTKGQTVPVGKDQYSEKGGK